MSPEMCPGQDNYEPQREVITAGTYIRRIEEVASAATQITSVPHLLEADLHDFITKANAYTRQLFFRIGIEEKMEKKALGKPLPVLGLNETARYMLFNIRELGSLSDLLDASNCDEVAVSV